LQIKTIIVSCRTAESKPVKQEVSRTVILPPLVFPGIGIPTSMGKWTNGTDVCTYGKTDSKRLREQDGQKDGETKGETNRRKCIQKDRQTSGQVGKCTKIPSTLILYFINDSDPFFVQCHIFDGNEVK
jgi:hypothetical protein